MCGPTSTSTTAISKTPDARGGLSVAPLPLRILGIDPGSSVTGFGIIEVARGGVTFVDAGAIRMAPTMGLPARLQEAATGILQVVRKHRPGQVCLESVFHHRNARSVIVLAHLRGALMLELQRAGLPIHEYAPREIKKAVAGHGQADKEQVRAMVRRLLRLETLPRPLDVSDALAVAICHAHTLPVKRAWSEG